MTTFTSSEPVAALFLDVAQTLLGKPGLMPAIGAVLTRFGHRVKLPELALRHRLLCEATTFPDHTTRDFYQTFNTRLLHALAIRPHADLLDAMFAACRGLPWSPFADVAHLQGIRLPIGILSNWDLGLRAQLSTQLPWLAPRWLLGSAECGLRKPDPGFFQRATEASGLSPETIAYVGDSPALDIAPALALGWRAMLIDREDFYPHADCPRIRDFSELSARLALRPD